MYKNDKIARSCVIQFQLLRTRTKHKCLMYDENKIKYMRRSSLWKQAVAFVKLKEFCQLSHFGDDQIMPVHMVLKRLRLRLRLIGFAVHFPELPSDTLQKQMIVLLLKLYPIHCLQKKSIWDENVLIMLFLSLCRGSTDMWFDVMEWYDGLGEYSVYFFYLIFKRYILVEKMKSFTFAFPRFVSWAL